jgi:sugar lactone lactonase YvrE
MILFKCDPISLSRAFWLRATVISSLGLSLLLLPGCLNTPKQETTPASAATGKVRKVPKAGGTVSDLATGQNGPAGLVLDTTAGYLYFTETNAGTIKRVLKVGGTVQIIVDALLQPYDIVYEQGTGFEVMYFVEYNPSGGRVQEACIVCPPPGQLGDLELLATGQLGPLSLTYDANWVYYVNRQEQEVMKVPKDASVSPSVLVSGLADPQDIVEVSGTLYFTDADTTGMNGALKCVPTTGGSVTTIVSGLNQPGSLETDGTSLYFAEVAPGTSSGMIRKIANVTCAAGLHTISLADGLSEPRGIAIDTNNGDVYYTEWAGGRIGQVPNGGVQATLVSGLNHPFRLIIDGIAIYFTETATIF